MSVRSIIKKLLNRSSNRQHYLKFRLDHYNNWSIRYFFVFDTRNYMNGKWFLKSHHSKDYIELSKKEALDYIESYNCRSCEEIHGVITADDGYQKTTVIHPL
jgi:hypothetical protein